MTDLRLAVILTIAILASSSIVAAATIFSGGDFVQTVGNWDNGLPTSSANSGTISVTGRISDTSATPLTDYFVTQSGGTISNQHFGGTAHSGGEWNLNGGSYVTRQMNLSSGHAFSVGGGGMANLGNNNKDVVLSSGASFAISGGSTTLGRHLFLNGGSLTISGGTLTGDIDTDFGCRNFQSGGDVYFNGGTTNVANLTFGNSGLEFIFGGTSAGSLTADLFGGDRHNDGNIGLDFLAGTQMSMTLTDGAMAGWAETQWDAGRLFYNGDSSTDLGLSWAAATSTGFGDGHYFDFDGSTLSLVAPTVGSTVPEPSSFVLAGLVLLGLGWCGRRQRKPARS